MNALSSHSDVLSALHTLLAPLDPHLSAGAARVKLGHTSGHFDDDAAELEGFARRLWGAVPAGIGLPAGEDGIDWDAYMDGIEHGVDPNDSEYWGAAVDKDQRLVEVGRKREVTPTFYAELLAIDGTYWLRARHNP